MAWVCDCDATEERLCVQVWGFASLFNHLNTEAIAVRFSRVYRRHTRGYHGICETCKNARHQTKRPQSVCMSRKKDESRSHWIYNIACILCARINTQIISHTPVHTHTHIAAWWISGPMEKCMIHSFCLCLRTSDYGYIACEPVSLCVCANDKNVAMASRHWNVFTRNEEIESMPLSTVTIHPSSGTADKPHLT